jgi:uncharacterized RDD family membrane protein YckC
MRSSLKKLMTSQERMTTIDNNVSRVQPAGFWRRIFAGIFDLLFLGTAAMILLLEVTLVVSLAESYGWTAHDAPESELLLWLILGLVWFGVAAILVPVLYYTLAEGAYGQTLGKAIFGIAVVADDGQPISYGRAFARLITLPYALVPAGIGLLWAALPPAKRAWHDYISATRVITAA